MYVMENPLHGVSQMSLLNHLPEIDDEENNEAFYRLQETHLEYLRNHTGNRILTVPELQADIYAGDYYGLLNYLRIDKKYHYLVMRINGLFSSGDYNGENVSVIVPSFDVVNRFMTIYATRHQT
jgi:hypothetical protein